jgi:hypothetical protein
MHDMTDGKAVQTRGFNFTDHMRIVCADMVERVPALSHIDLARVAMACTQVRNREAHGVLATMTPLRFEAGAETTVRRGKTYTAQRLRDASGREMLYILTCFLPRFMNYTLEEKILTLLHELWHISPEFNGDLRRFAGRCYAHGGSQAAYDRQVEVLAKAWWSLDPPRSCYEFLEGDFPQLQARHGQVLALRVSRPKLIPVG